MLDWRSLRGEVSVKSNFLKELTPRSRTYELRGQGKKEKEKSSIRIKDKQGPPHCLTKIISKSDTSPLNVKA